jgi:hypothetical protein
MPCATTIGPSGAGSSMKSLLPCLLAVAAYAFGLSTAGCNALTGLDKHYIVMEMESDSGAEASRPDASVPEDAGVDGRATEDGPSEASSKGPDSGGDDAGLDGTVGPAADGGGTGAVGVLGSACSSEDAGACAGNAQKITLRCTGSWTQASTCPSDQNCDSTPGATQGTCAPIDPLCAGQTPGATVCGSNATVVRCGPDLVSSSPVATCTGQACIAGACAGSCTPRATQCSIGDGGGGGGVETCSSTGTWSAPIACTNSTCSAGACTGTCTPGTSQCSGNAAVQTCGSSGMLGAATRCTDQACAQSGGTASCTGVCAPGATQCTSNGVATCSASGTWGTPAACSSQTCVQSGGAASCAGVCAPGQTHPVTCGNCGTNTQTCSTSGTWQDGTCSDQGVCAPSATETCDTYGSQTCTSSCAWGACSCPSAPVCTPNAVQCSGNGVQTCNGCGQWGAAQACTTTVANATDTCVNGVCMQTCNSGYAACGGAACSVNMQTNGANCGSCGHSCLGGGCAGGLCQPIALAGVQNAGPYIAVDTSSVYWSNDALYSCPLGGGCGSGNVIYPQPNGVYQMVATSQYVYMMTSAGEAGGDLVQLGPKPSLGVNASSILLTPEMQNIYGLQDLVLASGQNVFYTYQPSTGTVYRMQSDGSQITAVMETAPGSEAYIGIDSANVYTPDSGNSRVIYCDLGDICTTNPRVALSGISGPSSVYSDGTNLWVTGTSSIWKCPVGTNCGTPAAFAANQATPWQAIADATYVYWTNEGATANSGELMRCPVSGCGGSPTVWVSGLNSPTALTQDGSAVYFVDGSGIYKAAK